MNDRDLILSSITDHFGARPEVRAKFAFAVTDLWQDFERNLGALGGRIIAEAELRSLAGEARWVEKGVAEKLCIASTVDSIWDAKIGFARADFAIAQMGTLVFSAGPRHDRLSTLVPPINVVVVVQSDIVPTLNEALPRLTSRSSVFVTGPSRTADIEGVLVRGVHGPGEVLVYVEGRG